MGATRVGDGSVISLCNAFELNGMVSTHPRDVRGYASMNSYLVVEPDGALLIDTGLSVHEDEILKQVGAFAPAGVPLSLYPLRMGEFNGICNVRSLTDSFEVDVVYGLQLESVRWMDFRPEYQPHVTEGGGGGLAAVRDHLARPGELIPVGQRGRSIVVNPAPLRLLPVTWLFDETTGTLFTADAFTWVSQPSVDGPWQVTSETDVTTEDEALHHLVFNRFWWLPGARTNELRSDVADVFRTHDVQRIAPGYGCVIEGRGLVEHHVAMLDRILARVASMPATGVAAGRWPVKTGAIA